MSERSVGKTSRLGDHVTKLCFVILEWVNLLEFENAFIFSGCLQWWNFLIASLQVTILNVRKRLQIFTCTDRAGVRSSEVVEYLLFYRSSLKMLIL